MLPCLNPLDINVHPFGTRVKKDGTLGHALSFGMSSLPDSRDGINVFCDGSDPLFVRPSTGEVSRGFIVPCGKCVNCRRNRSFRWSRRILMESDGVPSDDMCFLTLTYDDEHLPSDGELHYEHVQKWLKRLRKDCPRPLRFFLCGEYGDLYDRCHWHVILFGYDFFTGSKVAGYSEDCTPLFHNSMIDKSWPFGFAEFGMVTPASIQYVAGYVTKKLKADRSSHKVQPFVRMSLKPGIGHKFLLKNADKIARDEGFYLNGKFYRVDAASLRFLLREEKIDSYHTELIKEKQAKVAEMLSNQYKLVSNVDKRDVDKTLAMWYNTVNRLGNIYGRKG